ncbi:MAG: hypothetical protein ACTSQE_00015 [Candidatus Heimdallarchaeaceae archaeon]
MAMAGVLHAFLPFKWLTAKLFSIAYPQNSLTTLFGTSFIQLLFGEDIIIIDLVVRVTFTVLILILAFVNMLRTYLSLA